MTKIVATIECRMTSSRLPGKILLPACGKPLLELMIERLQRVPQLDDIVIATTTNSQDDCLSDIATKMGTGFFRGSEHDVLARVLGAARAAKADLIVEMTSDCPLMDPVESTKVIQKFLDGSYDYVSNVLTRSYPRGMETQIFPTRVLSEVDQITRDPADRENVSLYIYEHPERFILGNVMAPPELADPEQRMTLDYPEDYQLIKTVFEALYPSNPEFSLYDVMSFLRAHPEVAALTHHLQQKAVRPPVEAACP